MKYFLTVLALTFSIQLAAEECLYLNGFWITEPIQNIDGSAINGDYAYFSILCVHENGEPLVLITNIIPDYTGKTYVLLLPQTIKLSGIYNCVTTTTDFQGAVSPNSQIFSFNFCGITETIRF